jgi:hypothetical protein
VLHNPEVVGSTPYPCCQVNGPGMALIPPRFRAPTRSRRFKSPLTREHTRPFGWRTAVHVTFGISSRSNIASITAIIRKKAPWATRQSCHPRPVSSDDPVDVRPKVAALGSRRPAPALCRYRQWWRAESSASTVAMATPQAQALAAVDQVTSRRFGREERG